MRRTIKRGSKFSLFLFIASIFIILGGVILTVTDSPRHFYLVLVGFGAIFLALSNSEVEQNRYALFYFGFGVFASASFFWASYFHFYVVGKIIMAKWFVFGGILMLGLAFYTYYIHRRESP